MPRTLRDYGLTVILCVIMLIVLAVMMPFFGPQPLSNPIAVIILLVVLVISCCLLSMNQYIIAGIKSKKEKRSRKVKTTEISNIVCPHCKSSIKARTTFCTECGNKI